MPARAEWVLPAEIAIALSTAQGQSLDVKRNENVQSKRATYGIFALPWLQGSLTAC